MLGQIKYLIQAALEQYVAHIHIQVIMEFETFVVVESKWLYLVKLISFVFEVKQQLKSVPSPTTAIFTIIGSTMPRREFNTNWFFSIYIALVLGAHSEHKITWPRQPNTWNDTIVHIIPSSHLLLNSLSFCVCFSFCFIHLHLVIFFKYFFYK